MEAAAQRSARPDRPREDWFDEEFVTYWIAEQDERAIERHRQFVRVRSALPKEVNEPFRYVNLGAGPGHLDEILLDAFRGATAVLVDGSPGMLAAAAERLRRFEGRFETVQADFSSSGWTETVGGDFDLAVSTIAIHNLRDPRRIREFYAEVGGVLRDDGMFVNLDYVRIASPLLIPLAGWAARDPEAEFQRARAGSAGPGTVEEQLGWMREAGFRGADCPWREWQAALLIGLKGEVAPPA
jgi:tRNA (cmo5U34)-methyltransferase